MKGAGKEGGGAGPRPLPRAIAFRRPIRVLAVLIGSLSGEGAGARPRARANPAPALRARPWPAAVRRLRRGSAGSQLGGKEEARAAVGPRRAGGGGRAGA